LSPDKSRIRRSCSADPPPIQPPPHRAYSDILVIITISAGHVQWFAYVNFRIRYAAHVKAQARREYEAVLRPALDLPPRTLSAVASRRVSLFETAASQGPAVRRIQTFAAATDGQRGLLGITIPDRTRTPVGAPTSRPLVKVDFSKRLAHRLAYVDEAAALRRARPRGIVGAEVWVKVAAPGESPPTLDTRLPRRGRDRKAVRELRSPRRVKGRPVRPI
jgi:hypothetical protein